MEERSREYMKRSRLCSVVEIARSGGGGGVLDGVEDGSKVEGRVTLYPQIDG